jgi:NADPH:quinone reductase-like Zn-dependent oxidoreductase
MMSTNQGEELRSQPDAALTTMNAVRLHSAQGPAGLVYEQIPVPGPGPGEVLVRVRAAAITRDELDWPVDRLPAIPSYEFSGVVARLGAGVSDLATGDEVFALSPFDRDGAAAEYILVPAHVLAPKPHNLDYTQSAAIPLAALSAWQGLFAHGGLTAGQRVLIHGAAGGVGSFAVQLARQRGAEVIGTTSAAGLEMARKAGAGQVIDYTVTPFEQIVGAVDLVFDTAGGERLARSHQVIRPGGRLVSVAAEPSQESAAARGIQAIFFVVSPNRAQLIEIGKLADEGLLQPSIDQVFDLADARAAFEHSLHPHRPGKIVLRVSNTPHH